MGTRIHRVIGYGVEAYDLNKENMEEISERSYLVTVRDFVRWGMKKYPDVFSYNGDALIIELAMAKSQRKRDPDSKTMLNTLDSFIFNQWGSYGEMNGPLLFQPLGVDKSWRRYDDIIDYMDADHNNLDSTVKFYDMGIHPYSSWAIYDDSLPNGYKSGVSESLNGATLYTPFSIKMMLEYLGFHDPNALWRSLKPMSYTYWS